MFQSPDPYIDQFTPADYEPPHVSTFWVITRNTFNSSDYFTTNFVQTENVYNLIWDHILSLIKNGDESIKC